MLFESTTQCFHNYNKITIKSKGTLTSSDRYTKKTHLQQQRQHDHLKKTIQRENLKNGVNGTKHWDHKRKHEHEQKEHEVISQCYNNKHNEYQHDVVTP